MTSIAGLERRGGEEEKGEGGGKRGTFANRFLFGFFMNETWIGCWLLPPPPPPPGGWVDMEAEGLRDVPRFIGVGREEEGIVGSGDRPSSKGIRATAAGWTNLVRVQY